MQRLAISGSVVLALAVLSGCALTTSKHERATPEALKLELEKRLLIPIKDRPLVSLSAAFTNVAGTLNGAGTDDRLLAIVFDTEAATVQVLGDGQEEYPGDEVIVDGNVVVFYSHAPDSVDRESEIRAAIAASLSSD